VTVEITIIDDHPSVVSFPLDELRALSEFASRSEPGGDDLTVLAVLLTSDARMRELHRDFMGLDTETDVMTFPVELEPGEEGRGGDIVISVDRAAENGREVGNSPAEEVGFLIVHGILHLCGWDDHDSDARARMLTRQTEIIRAFRAAR
jgi:probable rRNA maturation factor